MSELNKLSWDACQLFLRFEFQPIMSELPVSAGVLLPHFSGNSCITAIGPDFFLHQSLDKTELSFEQYDPCLNVKHFTSSIPKKSFPTSSEVSVFTF